MSTNEVNVVVNLGAKNILHALTKAMAMPLAGLDSLALGDAVDFGNRFELCPRSKNKAVPMAKHVLCESPVKAYLNLMFTA